MNWEKIEKTTRHKISKWKGWVGTINNLSNGVLKI
jgi:hypothetical protein